MSDRGPGVLSDSDGEVQRVRVRRPSPVLAVPERALRALQVAMRFVAVVQARVGSTRLPGKILRRVGYQTVLNHVLARALAIPGVAGVHVTTTPAPEDDTIAARCRGAGVGWSRGQSPLGNGRNDVLAGYVRAAEETRADAYVRITSDCPLLDPAAAAAVLEPVLRGDADYASNVCPPTLYDGCDAEVFTARLLARAGREAGQGEREHVTTWMRRADGVRRANVAYPGDWSAIKLSVDTAADLERVRRVWTLLPKSFGWRDVVRAYRLAYPPAALKRARRIFGRLTRAGDVSRQVEEYLRGLLMGAQGERPLAKPTQAFTVGWEDAAELGYAPVDDELRSVRDLLGLF